MIDDVLPSANLYRYSGSLTTPPCSEDVKWHVVTSKTGVSKAQVYAYKMALETVENFRPTQPINSRIITTTVPAEPLSHSASHSVV